MKKPKRETPSEVEIFPYDYGNLDGFEYCHDQYERKVNGYEFSC